MISGWRKNPKKTSPLTGSQGNQAGRVSHPVLSIIVPTLNEAAGIDACLAALQPFRRRSAEVILVDGGSKDNTCTRAATQVDQLLHSAPGRARQMNTGAAAAQGEVLVFLHADTFLPADADRILAGCAHADTWGRFDVRLDGCHLAFRLIETLMNLRSRLTGIATGDQAMFAGRRLFTAAGGFPAVPLMEDVRLSKALRRRCRPICLRPPVVSSSRRWRQHGIAATVVRMWCLRLAHALGVSPERLARHYH